MDINSIEFNLFIILTLILLGTKLIFFLYLGKEVIGNKKRRGVFEYDFLFGFFILIVCLFFSRLFYMYFDLILTQTDPEKQYLPQNVIYWKIGGFIAAVGLAFVLFTIEKIILKFKLKGIPCIILISSFIFVLFFPVNSAEDYEVISIFILFPFCLALLIPVIFTIVGVKYPEIRKICFLLTFGVIIYLLGNFIVHRYFKSFFIWFNEDSVIIKYLISAILKILGLFIISYCGTNLYIYNYFTKLNPETNELG